VTAVLVRPDQEASEQDEIVSPLRALALASGEIEAYLASLAPTSLDEVLAFPNCPRTGKTIGGKNKEHVRRYQRWAINARRESGAAQRRVFLTRKEHRALMNRNVIPNNLGGKRLTRCQQAQISEIRLRNSQLAQADELEQQRRRRASDLSEPSPPALPFELPDGKRVVSCCVQRPLPDVLVMHVVVG